MEFPIFSLKNGPFGSPKVDQIPLVKNGRARDYGPMSSVSIRPATLNDLTDLYRVAIKTGNSGSDATGMFRNDDMIGEVYVGPYLTLASETCFALESNDSAVGYGLCVLDSEAFQKQTEESWWPNLQEKYRELSSYKENEWLIHEIFHPSPSPIEILDGYPSHGHIDLLPEFQGQGWGRKVMESMERALSDRGSRGFHLRVSKHNSRGLKFYAALRYQEIMRRESEVIVGKRLNRE